jgi:hypothetical protein
MHLERNRRSLYAAVDAFMQVVEAMLSIPGQRDRRFRLNVTGCSGGT